MFYNPPMSYYEPPEEPEYESRMAEDCYHVVTVYNDGDSFGDAYTAEEIKDFYNEIKSNNEDGVSKIKVYAIYERYYEDEYGDAEIVESEIGELLHTEEF